AVNADALAILDARGGGPGADDGGQSELARDDRGVAHRAANVGYRTGDLLEDRRPGRVGDLADENVPLAHAHDLLHRLHHARRALGHAAGGGIAADLAARTLPRGAQPGVQTLARDAPEHD